MPGGSDTVEKRPRSLVSNSNEAKLRSWPEETITVAPIWGVPAASMTMPVIFPVFGAARSADEDARAKQKSSAEKAARYFRTFTGFLPPLWLRRGRGPHGVICRRGNGFLGQVVGHRNFQFVITGGGGAGGGDVFERELFAMLGQFILGDIEFQDRVGGFILGDAVFHGGVGLMGFVVHFEVINLEENAHLVAGAEIGVNARTNFYVAQYELAQADVVSGDTLNLIGKDQSAGRKAVVFEARHGETRIHDADVTVVGVFQDDIETIEAGRKRDSLLVDRSGGHGLLQRSGRDVATHVVFKRVHDTATEAGDPAEQIDGGGLDAVFLGKTQLLGRNLNGDGNQNRIGSNAQEVGAVLELHLITDQAGSDHGFKIFEFYGRGLEDFGVKLKARKFLHRFRGHAYRRSHVSTIGVVETARFAGQTQRFQFRETGARNVQQCVLFAGVGGELVLTAHGGVNEFDFNVLADAFEVAIAPVFKWVSGSLAATFGGRPIVASA